MKRLFFCCLFCILFHSFLQGQVLTRSSSLRDFEEQALKRNLSLLSGRLDIRQAEADIITAGLRQNPVATLVADILPFPGERFSPNDKQYGLSVALPIETNAKREYRLETAQNLALLQKMQVQNAARQILLAVRLAYFDALGAQEQVSIATANVDSYKRLVALNEIRYKSSQISQTEFSRSELALEQAELQLREAELSSTKAERALLLAIGDNDATSDITFTERLQALTVDSALTRTPLETLQKQALDRRYDVLAARLLKASAEANQRLQEANALPDLTIAPEFTMQQTIPMYGVTGSMALPFNNRNEGERQKAVMRIEQSERQISLAALTVKNEVQTSFAEFQMRTGALQRYRSSSSPAVPSGILSRASGIKSASELSYKAGGISLLELLDAVRIYNEIYKSYVDALTLFNKSVVSLIAALGADVIAIE